MAHLAIKGHATRGKEVIEILEMLGGINSHNLYGDENYGYYIIESNKEIKGGIYLFGDEQLHHFTLEEFLEKYPFKVGDKVYSIIHSENQTVTDLVWDFQENEVVYKTNNNEYVYVNYLQPYKEENMVNKPNLLQQLKEYFENTPQEVIETEWHEYAKYNEIGPSVEEYLEYVNNIRQPQHPKTFVDCCEILYPNENFQIVSQPIKGHNGKKLFVLQKLLICRDAYWKIAGDWEPNWEDETDIYYTISYDGVNIKCYNNTDVYSKLAFPTEEMRDAFYENFKELIEECKEFL